MGGTFKFEIIARAPNGNQTAVENCFGVHQVRSPLSMRLCTCAMAGALAGIALLGADSRRDRAEPRAAPLPGAAGSSTEPRVHVRFEGDLMAVHAQGAPMTSAAGGADEHRRTGRAPSHSR